MSLVKDKALYLKARAQYYNDPDNCDLTDAEYDALEDKIKGLDPKWEGLKKTGIRVHDKKTEVELPQLMPSLDKVYPEAVPKWQRRQRASRIVVANKLDGSSIFVRYQGGKRQFMATRGDGELGGDISFMLPYIDIPEQIDDRGTVDLRIEAVMETRIFEERFSVQALGPKKGKKNPRNMVAGILNRTKASMVLEDLACLHFVVLGVYGKTVEQGLSWAKRQGFETVRHGSYDTADLDASFLSMLLDKRLEHTPYEMDGLVLAEADAVFAYANADKPKWTIAFKKNTDLADAHKAKVLDVIYTEAKSKKLTPVAIIEPTEIGGATVTQVTMSNIDLLEERQVGPGAVIKVVRSGDVIPFWIATVKPAPIKYPSVPYRREGCWLFATEFSLDAEHERILHMFVECGIKGIALKSIAYLYDYGFTTFSTYAELASWEPAYIRKRLVNIGFGTAKSKTLAEELGKLKGMSLATAIVASAVMPAGIGNRKLEAIGKVIPLGKLVTLSEHNLRKALQGIHGIGDATIDAVVEGMQRYKPLHSKLCEYLQLQVPTEIPKESPRKTVVGPYVGMRATWTGYRSPEQEQIWVNGGGELQDSFSSKTTHLFWKPGGKKSTKVDKAGDRAYVWEEFVNG